MRHRNSVNHLGRTSSHRKALLTNMANSLLLHKRISTTLAKAKELRKFVEPLITRAKDDSTHNRREVFKNLKSKTVVSELFRDIVVKVGDRPGGYTRILKTGNRIGDNSEMCIIELVDYNENLLTTKETTTKKAVRRRKPATKKATEASAEEAPVAEKAPKAKATKAKAAEEVVAEEVVEKPVVEEANETQTETEEK